MLALLLLATAFGVAADDDFAYVFTRGDRALISGNMDLDDIGSMRSRYSGDYLWARRGGRAYLIRDAATIREARAAFKDADVLHAEYERLASRMRPVEQRQHALEEQIDRISDEISDNENLTRAETRAMEERLRALEEEMRPIERELQELEREEARIDAREEKLVAIAEQQLRQIVDRAIARGLAERLR